MSHCDDSAILKAFVHGLINDRLSSDIDVSCCFVYQHNLGGFENGSGDADELPFADAEILTIFCDFSFKAFSFLHGLSECA